MATAGKLTGFRLNSTAIRITVTAERIASFQIVGFLSVVSNLNFLLSLPAAARKKRTVVHDIYIIASVCQKIYCKL